MSYLNYHQVVDTGRAASALLDPVKTGIFSIALFSSSGTVWLAEVAHEKGSKSVRYWLLATIVLGAIFLSGQGWEYSDLLSLRITISQNLFGSSFFTLTGFHGLHVFIGLLLLCILFALSCTRKMDEPASGGMQSIALYWHFVDAVWVVIFSVVYLWRFV